MKAKKYTYILKLAVALSVLLPSFVFAAIDRSYQCYNPTAKSLNLQAIHKLYMMTVTKSTSVENYIPMDMHASNDQVAVATKILNRSSIIYRPQ